MLKADRKFLNCYFKKGIAKNFIYETKNEKFWTPIEQKCYEKNRWGRELWV
jgi:hypothetical protein